jgi:hypothetical protein
MGYKGWVILETEKEKCQACEGTGIDIDGLADEGVTIDYETQKLLAKFVGYDFSRGVPFPIR